MVKTCENFPDCGIKSLIGESDVRGVRLALRDKRCLGPVLSLSIMRPKKDGNGEGWEMQIMTSKGLRGGVGWS